MSCIVQPQIQQTPPPGERPQQSQSLLIRTEARPRWNNVVEECCAYSAICCQRRAVGLGWACPHTCSCVVHQIRRNHGCLLLTSFGLTCAVLQR
eukprot:1885489-Rhodomonas_salina.2